MIDDRNIMGANPFDATLWKVQRQGGCWVVLDGLGNPIHEAPTKGEAKAWVAARMG